MRNKATLIVAIATALTTACSGPDHGGSRPSPIAMPYAEPTVTVEGTTLPGIDAKAYTCQADPGSTVILMGPQPKDGGIGLILGKSVPRTVQGFTFTVDGVMYSAATNRPSTSAKLTHDGDRYTIKGTARSYDVEPPLLKEFTASVTCKGDG